MPARLKGCLLMLLALQVAAQGECAARCLLQPCPGKVDLVKLPPCHRKHLPDQTQIKNPCEPALIATSPTVQQLRAGADSTGPVISHHLLRRAELGAPMLLGEPHSAAPLDWRARSAPLRI